MHGFVECANPVGLVERHRIHIPDGLPHRRNQLVRPRWTGRRDGLTAWEQLAKKTVDWKASGGTVATPVHDAMIHLRASIPKLEKIP